MINRFSPCQKFKQDNTKAVHITLGIQLSSHCISAKHKYRMKKSVWCSRNAVSHQVINIESFAAHADAQFNKDVKDLQPF